MLSKDAIAVGSKVMLANRNVIGGRIPMIVKGLTAVGKLVYCEGGPYGHGLYHVDNLMGADNERDRATSLSSELLV